MTWQPHVVICCRVFRTVVRRNCNPRFGASDFGPGACEPAAALRTEMRLWVPETDGIHVQTRPRTGRSQSGAGDPPPEQAPGPRQRHARPMRRPDPGRRNAAPPPPVAYHYARYHVIFLCVEKTRARDRRPGGKIQAGSRIHTLSRDGRAVCGTVRNGVPKTYTPSKFDTTYGRRSRPRTGERKRAPPWRQAPSSY